MIKEAYERVRKKHNLPEYDKINNELEISSFESEDFLLRQINRKIVERIDVITEAFGSVLQPSADSLTDMHECRFFDDKDKKKMIEIYKKLMIFKHMTLDADLQREENLDVQLINDFFKEWPDIRKEARPFIKKLKTCWEKETEIEEKLEYFV